MPTSPSQTINTAREPAVAAEIAVKGIAAPSETMARVSSGLPRVSLGAGRAPAGRGARRRARRPARVIGATDLILAAGLLRGRRRWPWMVLRAALNAALAGHYAGHGRRAPALGMALLTAFDGGLATVLHRLPR